MLEKDLIYWGQWAILAVAATVILAIAYHFLYPRAARPFPLFRLIVVGLFVAMTLHYIPILQNDTTNGVITPLKTVALAAYRSLRVFLVDGEWENTVLVLSTITNGEYLWVKNIYEAVCLVELVGAPILSATFLLTFFSGVTARLRYFFSWISPVYVFSKLNAQSLAFAKSVRKERPHAATIVFTDVFYENGDDDYELLCEAKDLRAICLKRDITHLWFGLGWWKKVTCLVIGDDESENLAQAMALTEKWKKRRRTAIYVYATSVGSGYIMDSMEKGDLLVPPSLKRRLRREMGINKKVIKQDKQKQDARQKQLAEAIQNNSPTRPQREIQDSGVSAEKIADLFSGGVYTKGLYPLSGGFSVTRIDSVYNIVLDTFRKSDVFSLCNEACGEKDKIISLMIVGMGEYGKQVFKTALWYCQMEGYRLEINVIDSGRDKKGIKRDIEEVLRHECPEIFLDKGETEDGEAQYDVTIFKDIDCFSSSLEDVFEKNQVRLRRTLMAFVALGDDDKNIEAAILLRKLFDRLHSKTNGDYKALSELRAFDPKQAERKDRPRIYAVVYDDRKAKNLNINRDDEDDSYLVDYKGVPYHIHCIGNLSTHYSYTKLLENQQTEWKAFLHHTQWVSVERTIRHWLGHPKNWELCKQVLESASRDLQKRSEQLGNMQAALQEDGDRAVAEGTRMKTEGEQLCQEAKRLKRKAAWITQSGRREIQQLDEKGKDISEQQPITAKEARILLKRLKEQGQTTVARGKVRVKQGEKLKQSSVAAPVEARWLRQESENLADAAQSIQGETTALSEEAAKELFVNINWDDTYVWEQTREQQCESLLAEISKYMQFEYYRYSSVSKAAHKELVETGLFKDAMQCTQILTDKDGNEVVNPLCRCDACNNRRKTEHMRWNAYMRVNGYRYGKSRADRAQVHPSLVPAKELSWKDQFKD